MKNLANEIVDSFGISCTNGVRMEMVESVEKKLTEVNADQNIQDQAKAIVESINLDLPAQIVEHMVLMTEKILSNN
jgi:antitoxin component of RelBE/YafQ-DinJ toxin-antitoxin module